MHRPDSIEDILSRLIPPSLSEGGQSRIEAMIDDLAGPEASLQEAPASRRHLHQGAPSSRRHLHQGAPTSRRHLLSSQPLPISQPQLSATSLPATRQPIRWQMVGGIAAAAAITLAALIVGQYQTAPPSTIATVTRPIKPSLTLLEETGRVDDASNAGTVEESDGTSLQAWKYHVVEKDRMKDRATGLVVEVSQPRDEFLLMPVSAF